MFYRASMSILLLLALVSVTLTTCQSENDDISVIRQRVLEMIIWPTNDTIPGIVQAAIGYHEKLNASCYWEDINYADRTLAVWATEEHLT